MVGNVEQADPVQEKLSNRRRLGAMDHWPGAVRKNAFCLCIS